MSLDKIERIGLAIKRAERMAEVEGYIDTRRELYACFIELGVLRERLQRLTDRLDSRSRDNHIARQHEHLYSECPHLMCASDREFIAALVPEEAARLSPFSAHTTLNDSQPARGEA